MKLDLVEPKHLSRARMAGHRLPDLSCPQRVAALPLELDARVSAVLFHNGAVLGLEERLPAYVQLRREVAHVHQPLLRERLPDLRIEALIHWRQSAIGVSPPSRAG